MNKNYVVMAIVAVLIAAGSFLGGMKYQSMKRVTFAAGQMGANGRFQTGTNGTRLGQGGAGAAGTMRGGFRPVTGEIIAQDDKSITVKLMDGSSKIVMFSDSTAINKSAAGSKTDLTTGERVMVAGTENSDGSVTAQNIQLNPQMRTSGSPQPSGSAQPSASPKAAASTKPAASTVPAQQ